MEQFALQILEKFNDPIIYFKNVLEELKIPFSVISKIKENEDLLGQSKKCSYRRYNCQKPLLDWITTAFVTCHSLTLKLISQLAPFGVSGFHQMFYAAYSLKRADNSLSKRSLSVEPFTKLFQFLAMECCFIHAKKLL